MIAKTRFQQSQATATDNTDCHVHVIDPAFAMTRRRSYTPLAAPVPKLRHMMESCGLSRVVIVQISVYGNDNSAMLSALDELGDTARGVIHLQGDETPEIIRQLDDRGVRGVRINLYSTGEASIESARQRLAKAAALCAPVGWHVQLFTQPNMLLQLEADLERLQVPVILDHFALLSAHKRDTAQEQAVLRLRRSGHVWIKLSASYRLEGGDDPLQMALLAQDLLAPSPETVIWGTDWPHPPEHQGQPADNPPQRPYRAIETTCLVNQLHDWFPEPELRRKILVDNPARLFRFL